MVLSPALAEYLLFQPSKGDPGPPPRLVGVQGQVVSLTASDGVRVQAWWYDAGESTQASHVRGQEATALEGASPPPAAILFLHGNAGDISHRTPMAEGLLREGLSVLLLEYRGYGGSEGVPSEDGFHLDGLAAHDFLARKAGGSHRLVVFGRSMGGSVAARLAAARPSGGLILESAFTSLEGMGRALYPILPRFLFQRLKGRFSTLEWVGRVQVPVLIIHGTRDEIVPVDHGRELLAGTPGPKEWMEVEGARHNDVFWVGGASYFSRIAGFVSRATRGGSLSGGPTP